MATKQNPEINNESGLNQSERQLNEEWVSDLERGLINEFEARVTSDFKGRNMAPIAGLEQETQAAKAIHDRSTEYIDVVMGSEFADKRVTPEIIEQWVEVDLADFKKINDPILQENAAADIGILADSNREYRASILAKDADTFANVEALEKVKHNKDSESLAEPDGDKLQRVIEFETKILIEHNIVDERNWPTMDVEISNNFALDRIESRSSVYSDVGPRIVAEKVGPESLQFAVKEPDIEIDADTIAKWVEVDLADFKRLKNLSEQTDAAIAMAYNFQQNDGYKTSLAQADSEIYAKIEALDKINQQKIWDKETRKAYDLDDPFTENIHAISNKKQDADPFPDAKQLLPELGKKGNSKGVPELDLNSVAQDFERDNAKDRAKNKLSDLENEVESDGIFIPKHSESKSVIPPDIENQYTKKGDQYFHLAKPDELIFEDKGTRLETKSNDERVAQNLVSIALARGWDEIKISGSETFKKETWLAAAERGMHVKGYTPSEQDKEQLAKRVPQKAVDKDDATAAQKSFEHDTKQEALKKFPELAPSYVAVEAIALQAKADRLSPETQEQVRQLVQKRALEQIKDGKSADVKVVEILEVQKELHNEKEFTR